MSPRYMNLKYMVCQSAFFAALFWVLSPVHAAPFVAVNSADLGYRLSPGCVATLYYGEFGIEQELSADSLPLPFELGGVSVRVGGLDARLFSIAAGQVKFLMPDADLGEVQIVLTRADGRHLSGSCFLTEHAPAVFHGGINYEERGPNVLITLWANGIQIERCPNLQLLVGPSAFTPVFVGQSQFAGVEQLNFLVPKTKLTGIPNNNVLRADDYRSSGITFKYFE